MVVARLTDRVLGFASTLILARLLVPADFGLVAMATSVIAVVEVIGLFGFDMALIQNRQATRRHYDTAWTFNVIVGALVAAILVALAQPAAGFYAEPRVAEVLVILAAGVFITGFENIGVIAFRKELRFGQEFLFLTAKRVVVFGVTVPLAFILKSYWALVAGMVLGRLVAVTISYLVHPYRPRFSLAERTELFHFSKWMMVSAVLNLVSTRASDFIVGRAAGPSALGLFTVASELGNLPTSDLVAPINRAIYPGYAAIAADLQALKRRFLDVLGLIATLALPAGTGIAATAALIVPIALGPNWLDAIPILSAISFYGVLLALKSNAHYIYLALGRPRVSAFLGLLQSVILLPLIAIGTARAGAYGAALGCLIGQALFTPMSLAVMARNVERLRMTELLGVFVRPAIAAAVMFGVARLLAEELNPGGLSASGLIGPLCICVGAGALVYAGVLYILWVMAGRPIGPETHLRDWIFQHLSVLRMRAAKTSG